MLFTFKVNEQGKIFLEDNTLLFYPNVSWDIKASTVSVELPEPDKCSLGQFMSEIKRQGLLLGKRLGRAIIMSSDYIVEYPYEIEPM